MKEGLAQMLKGGIIMDVVNAEQARIAEEAGACAVMALERVPADIRKDGGVARMTDPKVSISLSPSFLAFCCASVPTLYLSLTFLPCILLCLSSHTLSLSHLPSLHSVVPTLKFYSLYCACVTSAASILCCMYRK